MLKINLEDLVINSLIILYQEEQIRFVEDDNVLNYKLALEKLLEENGIFYVIKANEEAYKKLEKNKYIDIIEKNKKIIYQMKHNVNYSDLLEVRIGLPTELINILEDKTLKKSLGILKNQEKQKVKKIRQLEINKI